MLVPSAILATPTENQVVEANIDTLYSAAVFDLSQHDIVFKVPQVDLDRYWHFPFTIRK